MKNLLLCLALGAGMALYSCGTEGDVVPVTPVQNPTTTANDTVPKIKLVMAKTWRLTGFTQGTPGSATQSDLYQSGYPNCQKDDTFKFKEASVLTVGPGNIKCNPSDADQNGTWDLNNNSTAMTLNNPAQTIAAMNGEFSVVEISASRIIITRVFNSSQYTLMFTAM